MSYTDMFSTAKAGLGIFSDINTAFSLGRKHDANTLAYQRNSLADVQMKKDSWLIQENSKDQAEFGGTVAMDAYLWEGGQKIKSIETQLSNMTAQLLMQENIAYEQSLAVDETVGNMMSRNGIEAMKAEARLVASSAGTGTEGGSTDVSTKEARSVEQFDNAVLIGRATGQKLNIQRRLSMERVSAKNKKAYVASQLGTVFSSNGAAAAWEEGYVKTYASIDKSLRSGFISHDKIIAEDTSTWMDDVLKYKDIYVNSGMDAAATDYFSDLDAIEAAKRDRIV